ncbi:hypothetical protein AXF42_Ash008391 [Apostasia shenzhenica]|uniref:CBF1-interacting co-repressor CIR N-terminal domain-containing protein n=1 Tax=Apostasia shenzhenica TaxID=1088818 RepID=A0A2I0AXQ2_9ASPA|nr:hypothetical protein AXF42_Ash008391 [Apostasia shenzhenica]
MALKFLNKKGWHTGSLRNIENVWKAEQKHDAEQKKLEELRKQILEERERSEFRQLQEQAGLVPRQERLDFLYESGLAVGKGSSEGFRVLQDQPSAGASSSAAEYSSAKAVPGALFEDKPQSANDTWRKLHSDPLFLIRQREQEALARIKNNPIRMAMIQKAAESEKQQLEHKKEKRDRKKHKRKHHHSKSKDSEDQGKVRSGSESSSEGEGDRRQRGRASELQQHTSNDNKGDWRDGDKGDRRRRSRPSDQHEPNKPKHVKHSDPSEDQEERTDNLKSSKHFKHGYSASRSHSDRSERMIEVNRKNGQPTKLDSRNREINSQNWKNDAAYNRHRVVPKMTDEEREARLREMQMNAELHEEQRSKRLKSAAEADALEAKQAPYSKGKSFLDATQKSIYGMEEGGRSTIEEGIRRRTYYSQGQSAHESNAFRR